MAEVRLDDVWKIYDGGVEAVRGFTQHIRDGEFIVLVGPSGCGKSTTLRMIAGLEEISRGTIAIGDRVVNDIHPKDRDIAMVFQNYALYPHMTVYKNMAFALKLRGVPRAEIDQRVRTAAGMLGIEALLERRPKALSGGQRQRVAVGRAIVREPKCFLFDEPLSNLDAKLRVTTRGELKALHQRLRTTTVYVTHDQEEAMTLGDRVCVMAGGIIQQNDTPFETYINPTNRFVAGFIGTPPMNFIDGRLHARGEHIWFVSEDAADGRSGAVEFRVHDEHAPLLRSSEGDAVVLGLRPQAMSEAAVGERHLQAVAQSRILRGRTAVIELLGDQMDVHLNAGPYRLTARVSSHAHLQAGQDAVLAIDTHACRYFAPGEFGDNLLRPSGVAATVA